MDWWRGLTVWPRRVAQSSSSGPGIDIGEEEVVAQMKLSWGRAVFVLGRCEALNEKVLERMEC